MIGVEGDFNRTSNKTNQTFTGTETSSFFTNTDGIGQTEFVAVTDVTSIRRVETDWTASARARFGWASDRSSLCNGRCGLDPRQCFCQRHGTDRLHIINLVNPAANTRGIIIGGRALRSFRWARSPILTSRKRMILSLDGPVAAVESGPSTTRSVLAWNIVIPVTAIIPIIFAKTVLRFSPGRPRLISTATK